MANLKGWQLTIICFVILVSCILVNIGIIWLIVKIVK